MEVLSEEESRQVIASMTSPFSKHNLSTGNDDTTTFAVSGQSVLLIHGPGEEYKLTPNHEVPQPKSGDEILVKVVAIGLNPVDWKGPDYNFGLPSLPWINGRDFAGIVVKASGKLRRIKVGDVILSPSTDYRDIRKAAFQEFVISTEFNCARIPREMPVQNCAAVGVAFVAASLALGICFGIDFSASGATFRGPNLLGSVRVFNSALLAEDIKNECLNGVALSERAKAGDWIAIWGASTATGLVAIQLAKLGGLRTIAVVDVSKYGERLLTAGADLLVDRFDTDRAISIIKGVTRGQLRFGLDAVGGETATLLQSTLSSSSEHKSHLAGLSGLPRAAAENVVHHKVPIKAFHDLSEVGETLMTWLERLLLSGKFLAPQIEIAEGGFEGINRALNSLRHGTVRGRRIVVPVQRASITAA